MVQKLLDTQFDISGSLKSLPSQLLDQLIWQSRFQAAVFDESLIMLKKLFSKMRRIPSQQTHTQKITAPLCTYHHIHLPAEHTPAANVIRELIQHGYQAYLVGGAVRDFLLNVSPKDFDVVTNATPEQVSQIFRRSRVIGKRFPIAHVMIGRDTIEVSTFRSGVARQNAHGRIMKDNAYGTIEQDAVRRDFTCNALYYDINKQQLIDFHNGLTHLKQGQLVMIGEPSERYQEDPVRILRAIRLAGKLNFEIEQRTAQLIATQVHLLKQEPVARLFDELVKIIVSGHAQSCLKKMHQLGIEGNHVHPLLNAMLHAQHNLMIDHALSGTDKRVRAGQGVSMGFVLAALLWEHILPNWEKNQQLGHGTSQAMLNAITAFHEETARGWGVPQHMSATMREIWALQPQLSYVRGKRPFKLLGNPRFRAAYDFLLIRAKMGEAEQELADWWTRFQHANDETRNHMANGHHEKISGEQTTPKRKKRRTKRKKRKSTHDLPSTE